MSRTTNRLATTLYVVGLKYTTLQRNLGSNPAGHSNCFKFRLNHYPQSRSSQKRRTSWLRILQVPNVTSHKSRLRRAAPSLRLNLPDAIVIGERVRKGTCANDGLALDRDSESP